MNKIIIEGCGYEKLEQALQFYNEYINEDVIRSYAYIKDDTDLERIVFSSYYLKDLDPADGFKVLPGRERGFAIITGLIQDSLNHTNNTDMEAIFHLECSCDGFWVSLALDSMSYHA